MVLARASAGAGCGVATPATAPAVYRARRPAATVLHRTVRENLETFLAQARQVDPADPEAYRIRPAVERALREYLRCGIAAHGFARVKCTACDQEYLLSFSCKAFDLCPSCGTRRMVETAAHLVDVVLPRVAFRQWVISTPKRVRWFLKHEPAVVDGILRVFLRAVETAVRRASKGAPREARFAAVAFVHRFGGYFNSHVHYHVLVSDGVFSVDPEDPATAIFHPAVALDDSTIATVRDQVRRRCLRWLVRHNYLDAVAAEEMLAWQHGGGWSLDASVHLAGWDRQGLERLVRYCARPPFSQERLGQLNKDTLVYHLRRPTVDGRTELLLTPLELLRRLVDLLAPPRKHRHRYCGVLAPNARLRRAVTATAGPAGTVWQEMAAARKAMGLNDGKRRRRPAARSWALLVARIYGSWPLQCCRCGEPMRIVAFILDPQVIQKILRHIGEQEHPPPVAPARGPPQGAFEFDQDAGQEAWPELDQTVGH